MSELHAVAYVSWGLWVADCPADGCRGAEHFGHAPITGAVGGLTRAGFACTRCGLLCPAAWPANADTIWQLLQQRPIVETRSWLPAETVEHLLAENVAHGLLDPGGLPAGLLMADGRFTALGHELVATATPGPAAIGGR